MGFRGIDDRFLRTETKASEDNEAGCPCPVLAAQAPSCLRNPATPRHSSPLCPKRRASHSNPHRNWPGDLYKTRNHEVPGVPPGRNSKGALRARAPALRDSPAPNGLSQLHRTIKIKRREGSAEGRLRMSLVNLALDKLACLSLSFLVCKAGVVTIPTSRGVTRTERDGRGGV